VNGTLGGNARAKSVGQNMTDFSLAEVEQHKSQLKMILFI
jgi:hypothetical protein